MEPVLGDGLFSEQLRANRSAEEAQGGQLVSGERTGKVCDQTKRPPMYWGAFSRLVVAPGFVSLVAAVVGAPCLFLESHNRLESVPWLATNCNLLNRRSLRSSARRPSTPVEHPQSRAALGVGRSPKLLLSNHHDAALNRTARTISSQGDEARCLRLPVRQLFGYPLF